MSTAYFNSTKTLLDDFAIQRRNNPSKLIAEKCAPMVPVDINSKSYPVWDDFAIIDSNTGGIRPPNAEAENVQPTYSLDTYNCQERAYQAPLDIRVEENAQPEFMIQKQYVNIVTDKQLLRREIFAASKLFNATTYTSYTAALTAGGTGGGYQWNNALSDPRVQVAAAKKSIRDNGVVDPEDISLVCNSDSFIALQNNATLLKTLNYTNPYAPSADILAKVLGIKEILVGSGVKKSGSTKSQIWGNYAWFGYLNPNPDFQDVSAAKTFVLKEKDLRIESWYNQDKSSWIYRSKWDYDVKITALSSAYLFSSVIA